MQAKDIMRKNPPVIYSDELVSAAAEKICKENLPGLIVIDQNKKVKGVVCEPDLSLLNKDYNIHIPSFIQFFKLFFNTRYSLFGFLMKKTIKSIKNIKVEKLMKKKILTALPHTSLQTILRIFIVKGFDLLPVVDKNKQFVGVIFRRDLAKLLSNKKILNL